MENIKAIVIGFSVALVASISFNALAADSGSRNSLKDGGGYEKQLEQSGMSGMSGMSGNHSSTAAPVEKKAKQEKKAKKPRADKKVDAKSGG